MFGCSRKVFGAGLLFCLAGCSGPNSNELLVEAPTRTIMTTATPEQARDCFVALDPAHFIPTPKNGGWLIIDTIGGFAQEAAFTVLILPTAGGTRVEQRIGYQPGLGHWPDYTKPCMDSLPK